MKQILIIGAGIAGIGAALGLEKSFKGNNDVSITLIDEENYHLFHASLYEVATSPEELTSLAQLKKSVAMPIKDIIGKRSINFLQGKVIKIDATGQKVFIGDRVLPYDYLVLALGATSNFYGIEGAEVNSFTLKTVYDSFRIRNRIEFLIQAHRSDISKINIRLAVAGGGFAGVEVAAEIQGFLDFIAWENNFPREKLETLIIEGSNTLMPGLGEQVQVDVSGRLRRLGVRIQTNSFITRVDKDFIEFKNGEKLSYDCLIWTAGVKANALPITPEIPLDRGQRIVVNESLQIPNHPNIFVIGDQACVIGKDGKPMPGTVPQAEDNAKYVAYALPQLLQNLKPSPHVTKNVGYIIPLGGKWMILKNGPIYITGYLAYIVRQFVFFRYFAKVLGFWGGLKLIFLETKLYSRNDD